jgi:5-methylcytosine-specific restriction protein A
VSKDRLLDKSIKDAPVEKGPHGFNLCRWCRTEVMPPRRTFCSMPCIHEWKLRNQPEYTKHCVKERDHGVCKLCGVDTVILHQELKKLWSAYQKDCAEYLDLSIPSETRRHNMSKIMEAFEEKCLKPVAISWSRFQGKRIWDVDHVLEVAAGGGSAGLDNLQTLCVKCHKAKTKKFLTERSKK